VTDDVESTDARLVDEAILALGKGDLATAERLIQDVVSRTPADYRNEREEKGTLTVRFWDRDDFLRFGLRHAARKDGRALAWAPNAYPRAHYYLGFLRFEQGDYPSALAALDAGLRLEKNPNFALEKARVLSAMGEPESALALLEDLIPQLDESSSPKLRALALRAKGGTLIELDRLDDAEASYFDALKLEPESAVAKNQLAYIVARRRGAPRASATTRATTVTARELVCSRCGKPFEEAKVEAVDGRLAYLCKRCERKLTKKWWQFWK
jgi:tetratricopeptide (TPR) repeat protein